MRRAQVILLINEDVHVGAIATITGYKRRQAFMLRKRYLAEGITALEDKRKGKPKELLTKQQRDDLREKLEHTTPENYGYESDYWTTGILANYIQRQYDVRYKSKTSYYIIFRQAKFTYHKPGRVYHEHNEEEIQRWKKQTKPTLKKIWQEKDTVILTGDEMILSTVTTVQKIWLKQGEYPKIEVSTGGRKRRSVYGFLNIRTGREHAFKTEKQNMYVTREILEQIQSCYPNKKIVLFWDNAGWHKGSVVREFLNEDTTPIEIIHFPRYAPEENPQEHVWKRGRSQCTHNKFIEDIDKATDEFIAYLNTETFPYALLGFGAVS